DDFDILAAECAGREVHDAVAVGVLDTGFGEFRLGALKIKGVVGQMEKLGLKIVINALDGAKSDDAHYAGRFDWLIQRNTTELSS
ncbi:hypothetical protein, partial [Rhizobium leguminosarum]|uniref:hypothetical protein n=1 Tax=Rhizobium leguminosarum TaxID=384 RepID=UPI003F9CD03C